MRSAQLHDFEEYFAARARPLRRTAYGLTGSWTQAEDLTQETFLRLYRRWQKIEGYDLDAYARRTMVNLYIDSRKFRHETPTERLPEPEQRTGDLDSRHDMGQALRGLPRQMRAVVVLRFIEDLPVREVAACLGIAEGTVKSLTHKAVSKLRVALGEASSVQSEGRS
jgi:RNA polymerase sigma-70 factor (sigma-E family)